MKEKINDYVTKHDLCGENTVNRLAVICQIIDSYKRMCTRMNQADSYLEYLNNDIVQFIGHRNGLLKKWDSQGLTLWDEMNTQMYKSNKLNEHKISLLLQEVPLYFLLSLLGNVSYKEKLET